MRSLILWHILLLVTSINLTNSAPSTRTISPISPRQSNPNDTSKGFQTSIYIPVIVIVAVLVVIVVGSVFRNRLVRSHLTRIYSREQANNGTRQLTAEQLAGGTGTNAASRNNGATTAGDDNAARRPRRNRRTASQMSVTSLPLYMEEAGDTELVLVRGEHEMQDALTDDDTTYRPTADERNMSLIDVSRQNIGLEEPSRSRPSYESIESLPEIVGAESTRRLMDGHERTDSITTSESQHNVQVPLEDAPAYSETTPSVQPQRLSGAGFREINLSDASPQSPTGTARHSRDATDMPNASNHAQEPSGTGTTASTRRMPLPNLRNFFHRTPPTNASSGENSSGASSSRNDNTRSGVGSFLQRSASRTHLLSHQRSTSTFSNASSLHLSPTSSRLTANPNTSTISLASISAPLQHTLVRTDIMYPRSGPSAEQMRFLGSRESLGRFGVPWGERAVKWAREEPPPFIADDQDETVTRADVAPATEEDAQHEEPITQSNVEASAPLESSQISEPPEAVIITPSPSQEVPNDRISTSEIETPAVQMFIPMKAALTIVPAQPTSTPLSPVLASPSPKTTSIPLIRESSPGPPTPPPTPPKINMILPASITVDDAAAGPAVSNATTTAGT